MNPTRIARVLLAVLLLAPATGLAKEKDKKGKSEEPEEILMTGIKAFDDVFTQIASIDTRLDTVEDALKDAKKDLNAALALEKGTPLKDAIADLQLKADGKLQVAMNGKQPKLEATDAVPQNVQDALDAVNGLTEALSLSVDEIQAIPKDMKRLTKATEDFPSRVKDELKKDPAASLKALPSTIKALKVNAEITAALPERSTKVGSRAVDVLEVVSTAFPHKPEGAEQVEEAPPVETAPAAGRGGAGQRGR